MNKDTDTYTHITETNNKTNEPLHACTHACTHTHITETNNETDEPSHTHTHTNDSLPYLSSIPQAIDTREWANNSGCQKQKKWGERGGEGPGDNAHHQLYPPCWPGWFCAALRTVPTVSPSPPKSVSWPAASLPPDPEEMETDTLWETETGQIDTERPPDRQTDRWTDW